MEDTPVRLTILQTNSSEAYGMIGLRLIKFMLIDFCFLSALSLIFLFNAENDLRINMVVFNRSNDGCLYLRIADGWVLCADIIIWIV
jgi:hypothetical protein